MRYQLTLLLLSTAILAACCSISPQIQTAEIAFTVKEVVGFHDTYASTDPEAIPAAVTEWKQESAALLEIVNTKQAVSMEVLDPLVRGVCKRTKSYLEGDASLDPLEMRTYIRSCDVLLSLVDG